MANNGEYSHVQLSPDELRALHKALTHTMATWMDPRGNHDLSPTEILLLTYLAGKFHGLLDPRVPSDPRCGCGDLLVNGKCGVCRPEFR